MLGVDDEHSISRVCVCGVDRMVVAHWLERVCTMQHWCIACIHDSHACMHVHMMCRTRARATCEASRTYANTDAGEHERPRAVVWRDPERKTSAHNSLGVTQPTQHHLCMPDSLTVHVHVPAIAVMERWTSECGSESMSVLIHCDLPLQWAARHQTRARDARGRGVC